MTTWDGGDHARGRWGATACTCWGTPSAPPCAVARSTSRNSSPPSSPSRTHRALVQPGRARRGPRCGRAPRRLKESIKPKLFLIGNGTTPPRGARRTLRGEVREPWLVKTTRMRPLRFASGVARRRRLWRRFFETGASRRHARAPRKAARVSGEEKGSGSTPPPRPCGSRGRRRIGMGRGVRRRRGRAKRWCLKSLTV